MQRRFVNILLSQKFDEAWTSTIISHYIVSLVTCWETFFRDVFVFLLKRHPNISKKVKSSNKVKKILGRFAVKKVDQEEYIASIFNFQNLKSLRNAFAPILGSAENIDKPTKQTAFMYIKNKGWFEFNLPKMFPKWTNDLDFILQERHRIIHDANHSTNVTRKDIQRIETVLFFYLQLFGIYISNRFQLPWIKLNTRISALELAAKTKIDVKNVVLTFDDLLSNEWEIVK